MTRFDDLRKAAEHDRRRPVGAAAATRFLAGSARDAWEKTRARFEANGAA